MYQENQSYYSNRRRIIQIDLLIRHISQEISQYVLIRIYNKHKQVTTSPTSMISGNFVS
jgi:hypothetical protein